MASHRRIDKHKKELRTLAESLPFDVIDLPEFKKASYEPVRIRQERLYSPSPGHAQAISRFLMERGTVEILKPEQVLHLFREIHWCGSRICRLSRKRHKSVHEARKSLVEARLLISQAEAAEEELFIANRRLVVHCVKPFFWIGPFWISDFLQEGSRALSNSIRKFDFTRGTPFYAYAQRAIQNRLRNYFRDHVRAGSIGVRPTWEMTAIKEALDGFKAKSDYDPDDAAVARAAGVSEGRVAKLRPFIQHMANTPLPPVSLDAMLGETDTSLYDFVEDSETEAASSAAERKEIWAAIDRLPERAGYIMRLRFIEGRTLEETGQLLNLTRARIKQIEDDSLKKIRQMLRRGVIGSLR